MEQERCEEKRRGTILQRDARDQHSVPAWRTRSIKHGTRRHKEDTTTEKHRKHTHTVMEAEERHRDGEQAA